MTEKEDEAELSEVFLSEPQTDVLSARTALILDMAGQGAGKTENIGLSSGYFVTHFPRLKGFIAANTYMQLNQSTLNKAFSVWERYFGLVEFDARNQPGGHYVIDKQPPAHFVRYEKLKSYNGTISFKNGAMIFVGSLENFKAHDGKEFAWAHLDETKDTKREALTTVILARLRQYGLWINEDGETVYEVGQEAKDGNLTSWNPCYIHTSPAEGGVDWIIDMFNLGNKEEDIRNTLADEYSYFFYEDEEKTVIIYQTYWNEENLPPGYIKSRRSQLSENEQLKFIDGYPFSKTGGEYFPAFSRREHVGKFEHTPGNAFHLTYDFNVMPYITQILADVNYVTKWIDKDGVKYEFPVQGAEATDVMQIKFIKEYCMKSPQNTTEQAAQAFIDDLAPETFPDVFIYGDASGRNRITGLGSLTQYKIIEGKLYNYFNNESMRVPRANVARLKRRDLINRILEGKIPAVEIYIDEDCKETVRDFEYVKLGLDGKFKETAKDPNTGIKYEKIGHCFISETKVQTIDGAKRIDEIKVGDLVLTREGYRRVLNVFDNGVREVDTYSMAGREITCTPDHLIFTHNRGFIKAVELMQSDIFCIFDGKEIKKWEDKQRLQANCKSLTVIISEDTQNQRGRRTDCILGDGLNSTESPLKYQPTFMSGRLTTESQKKAIISTIRMKTHQTTILKTSNSSARKNITRSTKPRSVQGGQPKYFYRKQSQHQKNGMQVRQAGNGIESIHEKHFSQSQRNTFVRSVERDLKAYTLVTPDIAVINARLNTGTTKDLQAKRVWDIEVEGNHEYFANGVLVHNCSDAAEYLICELCKHYLKEF